MIRKIYALLILGLCLGFAACGDDNDGLDPNAAAPVINFPMEQLDVDLNKVDNLPKTSYNQLFSINFFSFFSLKYL